jgi:uncharacterized membrane protein
MVKKEKLRFKKMLKKPGFFDIFGIFVFLYIIVISILTLNSNIKLPSWTAYILLIIGILGFLIDSIMVFIKYIKKQ